MDRELKPCPFCGCDSITFKPTFSSTTGHIDDWVGECNECLAQGPPENKEEKSLEVWNTRPKEDNHD